MGAYYSEAQFQSPNGVQNALELSEFVGLRKTFQSPNGVQNALETPVGEVKLDKWFQSPNGVQNALAKKYRKMYIFVHLFSIL